LFALGKACLADCKGCRRDRNSSFTTTNVLYKTVASAHPTYAEVLICYRDRPYFLPLLEGCGISRYYLEPALYGLDHEQADRSPSVQFAVIRSLLAVIACVSVNGSLVHGYIARVSCGCEIRDGQVEGSRWSSNRQFVDSQGAVLSAWVLLTYDISKEPTL
jgi:hypothetical protein